MKLFVGLGNPGSEYARQRHNVGFMAVERIAERHGLSPWKKRFHGLTCEGPIAGDPLGAGAFTIVPPDAAFADPPAATVAPPAVASAAGTGAPLSSAAADPRLNAATFAADAVMPSASAASCSSTTLRSASAWKSR